MPKRKNNDAEGAGLNEGQAPAKKATPSKKSEASSSKIEPTEAQILKYKSDVLTSNPRGVRLAHPAIESNLGFIAGYLGCTNTHELKDIMALPAINSASTKFLAARDAKFSLTKVPNTTMKELFNFVEDPDTSTWLSSPIMQPIEVKGEVRAYRSYLVTMHRFCIGAPRHFVAESGVEKEDRLNAGFADEQTEAVNGHSREDWSRAYWLLRISMRNLESERGISGLY